MNEQNNAFIALLKPHHDRLARFARAMTKSREDAEDLVNDTLLIALEHFDELREPQAFLSWLFTIASRLHKRKRWKAKIFDRFSSEVYDDRYEERRYAQPDTLVDVGLLYEALERLPLKYREAFVLFEISGFSLAEIQEIQGGGLSAVKMRLVRAREQLRDLLGDKQQRYQHKKEVVIHQLPGKEHSQQQLPEV